MRFAAPLILSAALLSARADSPVPSYEPFPSTYAEGERLGGPTTGVVWDTGNSPGTASPTNTIAAALSYPGLVTSNGSRGILLSDSPSSNRDRGTSFSPVQSINSGIPALYASFLLNVRTPPSDTTRIAYFRNSTSAGNPAPVCSLTA